jgi:hypothetical protein
MSAFGYPAPTDERLGLGAKLSIVAAHLMSASAALFTKSGQAEIHPSSPFATNQDISDTGRSEPSNGLGPTPLTL